MSYKKIGANLCLYAVILLIIEIAIRGLNLAPQTSKAANIYTTDSRLPYIIKPHIKKNLELWTGESKFLCVHNSRGLRDVEHAIDKPANTFRILGLGDSFAYGMGVAFEDTCLRRLERLLNQRTNTAKKAEVIKAGIPAYSPETERIFLEYYGIEYQPDLILVIFFPNDVVDSFFGVNSLRVNRDGYLEMYKGSLLGEAGKFFYRHSHLCRIFIMSVWTKFSLKFFTHWNDVYKASGFHEDSWKKVENEYAKIRLIAQEMKIPLVIVHVPESNTSIPHNSYPAERLARWCGANRVFFIDMLSVFERQAKLSSFYWREGHCNPLGHKIIAETIYAELLRQNLIF